MSAPEDFGAAELDGAYEADAELESKANASLDTLVAELVLSDVDTAAKLLAIIVDDSEAALMLDDKADILLDVVAGAATAEVAGLEPIDDEMGPAAQA